MNLSTSSRYVQANVVDFRMDTYLVSLFVIFGASIVGPFLILQLDNIPIRIVLFCCLVLFIIGISYGMLKLLMMKPDMKLAEAIIYDKWIHHQLDGDANLKRYFVALKFDIPQTQDSTDHIIVQIEGKPLYNKYLLNDRITIYYYPLQPYTIVFEENY